MSAYQRSAARERQLVNSLRDLGYVAYRTPASKGAADVIALTQGKIYLYQIKTGGKSAFSGFPPADRKRLLKEADTAGAKCALIWWPKGASEPKILFPKEWPSER